MSDRRASTRRRERAGRAVGGRSAPEARRTPPPPPRAGDVRVLLRTDPRTWSGPMWRQAISLLLFVVVALSGIGLVAVSAKNLQEAVIWGLLVLSVVVALWIMRAKR